MYDIKNIPPRYARRASASPRAACDPATLFYHRTVAVDRRVPSKNRVPPSRGENLCFVARHGVAVIRQGQKAVATRLLRNVRVCVIALPRLVVAAVGCTRPPHVGGCAQGPTESWRSVPRRKQFGPRKLHQSARGADGLKAVTFPAAVTGSYFTQSTHRRPPRAPCFSTIRLPHLRVPSPFHPAIGPVRQTVSAKKPADENATVEVEEEEVAPIAAVCRRRVRLYSRDLSLVVRDLISGRSLWQYRI